MIDPDVRPVDPGSGDDLAQLLLLEREARAALVGERGGDRWLVEHPEVGSDWSNRCAVRTASTCSSPTSATSSSAISSGCWAHDRIIRVDQVWVTPLARENGFGDALLAALIERAKSGWGRGRAG